MKSSFDILDALYQALNVSAITNIIDGSVFKGGIPAKDQKQSVEIAVLDNKNTYLQTGYVNVNFYCVQKKEGEPDHEKMQTVNTALMLILDNKLIGGIYFDVENQSGPHKDKESGRDGIYFTNLKIKFNTL